MIRPDYQTLENALQKRLFEIPNYQRAYSWTRKQVKDLHDDINRLKDKPRERHHFMATIVCLSTKKYKEDGTDEFSILHIVDGQQRLTTLIILLKTIEKYLNKENVIEKKEADKINNILVKGDERLILLQTNHDSSSVFANFLKKGHIPEKSDLNTIAELRLFESFKENVTFVKLWKESGDLLQLLRIIKNRLGFIFYELEDEGSVYSTFEVLNSRGLPVDWLDKCKSALMGIAFEKLEKTTQDQHLPCLHQTWSDIYRIIGTNENIPGHDILSFAATLHKKTQDKKQLQYLKKKLSFEDSLNYFKKYCTEFPTKTTEISDWIKKITIEIGELYNNSRLKALSEISHARLLYVSLMIMSKEKLIEKQKHKLIKQWENTTFRIFGLYRNSNGKKNDARTEVGSFTELASKIMDTKDNFAEINQLMYNTMYELINLGKKDYPLEEAINSMKNKDCYNNWENELIYFMRRYEEFLVSKANLEFDDTHWNVIWKNSPQRSIEHIMPQEANIPKWEVKKESSDFDKNINRLGNLCIIPLKDNIIAGNKSFETKKTHYSKNTLNITQEIVAVEDWNYKEIETREMRLLQWAKNEWNDLSLSE